MVLTCKLVERQNQVLFLVRAKEASGLGKEKKVAGGIGY
jgi:hypothetical protein